MMGLSDGRKSVRIGLAVLIQYRSVTDTQPASHVAVAITLNAQASSLKTVLTSTALICVSVLISRTCSRRDDDDVSMKISRQATSLCKTEDDDEYYTS